MTDTPDTECRDAGTEPAAAGSESDAAGTDTHRHPGAELARYYDLDLTDDPGDVELYLALASRTGGPVLELAAGTGRIAVPLAAAGLDVVAVDIDAAMLARAADRWSENGVSSMGTLGLVEEDLLTVDLGARFGLVIFGLNSLMLLGDAERQARAFEVVARHLRSDGLAVLDIWLPSPDDLVLYDGRLVLEWIRDDLERGERVAKQATARYDPATAHVELTAMFDAWPASGGTVRRVSRTDHLRLVGAAELVRLARDAGLRVETLAGDYALDPFGPGADRVVLVCTL